MQPGKDLAEVEVSPPPMDSPRTVTSDVETETLLQEIVVFVWERRCWSGLATR